MHSETCRHVRLNLVCEIDSIENSPVHEMHVLDRHITVNNINKKNLFWKKKGFDFQVWVAEIKELMVFMFNGMLGGYYKLWVFKKER